MTTTRPAQLKRLDWFKPQRIGELSERQAMLQGFTVFATVWRAEAKDWRWQITTASGRELPSFTTYATPEEAQRACEAWWNEHGGTPIRAERRMFLGDMRWFLSHTGA